MGLPQKHTRHVISLVHSRQQYENQFFSTISRASENLNSKKSYHSLTRSLEDKSSVLFGAHDKKNVFFFSPANEKKLKTFLQSQVSKQYPNFLRAKKTQQLWFS